MSMRNLCCGHISGWQPRRQLSTPDYHHQLVYPLRLREIIFHVLSDMFFVSRPPGTVRLHCPVLSCTLNAIVIPAWLRRPEAEQRTDR
jgi:hypothetical protein